jgi:copper(I)-binding protein
MKIPMRFPARAAAAVLAALLFGAATARADDIVKASDAWTRATVPGQKVAGLYMQLVSDRNVRLTGARSPVATSAEVHVMRMEAGVMKMRQVPYLELATGRPVALEPGGYHLMLFGLKVPLKAGDAIPVTLSVAETGKVRKDHKIVVTVQVRPGMEEPAKPVRR